MNSIDFGTDGGIDELWSKGIPVETLDKTEFKSVLKSFHLPLRDGLSPEDFTLHEVRVVKLEELRPSAQSKPSTSSSAVSAVKDIKSSGASYHLLFPIRYPGSGKLVGVKKVYVCPETKKIKEENIPSPIDPSKTYKTNEEVGIAYNRILPFPYGLDFATRPKNTSVVIVSSVLDALALRTVKNRSTAVVALAEGNVALPPEHIPFFETFKEITFWFPADSNSADSVSTFARKLGDKRCSAVTRDIPQPSLFHTKAPSKGPSRDMIQTIKKDSKPCSHEYITTFETLREDVYLEFANSKDVEGVKWKRFDKLNDYVRGFRRGELTVFTGRTGSGKTTFISEYSLDLCMQGVNTLWGSFEVRNVRLAKMQLKQFSGVNLDEEISLFDRWADKFTKLPMYYLTFHGVQEIDKVLDAMGYAVYVYDIAHVIIDNLQFMMGSGPGMKSLDRYHAQDVIIGKFRKFASLHNVHVTLVIHPRKEDEDHLTVNSIFGGAKATQEADNVLLLQEEEVNPSLKKKFIQVVKNRFTGDLGIVPLFFNRNTTTMSKSIAMKEKEKAKQKKKAPQESISLNPGKTAGAAKDSENA